MGGGGGSICDDFDFGATATVAWATLGVLYEGNLAKNCSHRIQNRDLTMRQPGLHMDNGRQWFIPKRTQKEANPIHIDGVE